jgi:hypothetical protein
MRAHRFLCVVLMQSPISSGPQVKKSVQLDSFLTERKSQVKHSLSINRCSKMLRPAAHRPWNVQRAVNIFGPPVAVGPKAGPDGY